MSNTTTVTPAKTIKPKKSMLDRTVRVFIYSLFFIGSVLIIAGTLSDISMNNDDKMRNTAVCENHGGQWIQDGCFKLIPVNTKGTP